MGTLLSPRYIVRMCLLSAILYLLVNTFSFGGNFATPGPKHLDTAMSYVGFKERGHNRGSLPDRCNKMAGVSAGSSWCASFGYYCMKQSGLSPVSKPRGRARAYINKHSIEKPLCHEQTKWPPEQDQWRCRKPNYLINHFAF